MNIQEKNLEDRKKDHIELATKSQVSYWLNDTRFNYEPLLGKHVDHVEREISFFKKKLKFPLWVSSMTGGTPEAKIINQRLAKACGEFGLGMGLGSCRALLEDSSLLEEFDVRPFLAEQPLFANLGIAQIEKDIETNNLNRIEDLLGILKADGLIIHVNPLQEWLQPEGDRINSRPLDIIDAFLSKMDLDVIVKEVGQGMGPESLLELMKRPVGIEFGAFGGTNFSQLELTRNNGDNSSSSELVYQGHNIDEMISFANEIQMSKSDIKTKMIIASGGIKSYLDGFYAVESLNSPAVYGQASALLNMARISYEKLQQYIIEQMDGYNLAEQFLRIRE